MSVNARRRLAEDLRAGLEERHADASAGGESWEEINAEFMIRSYQGELSRLDDLRRAGIYWQGSPESHQQAVAEARENLAAQELRLASWRALPSCTAEELERIADGEAPEEVVPGWRDLIAHQRREVGV